MKQPYKHIYLIALDGPDGVGKSTLINKLVEYFNSCTSYKAMTMSPSSGPFGLEVKRILKTLPDIPREAECNLHLASMEYTLAEVEKLQETASEENKLIIFLDRWLASTGVYQYHANGLGTTPFVKHVLLSYYPKTYQARLIPQILLHVEDESILDKRLAERKETDKYEASEFQMKVREGYKLRLGVGQKQVLDYYNEYDVPVNVSGTLEENTKTLVGEIIKLLH